MPRSKRAYLVPTGVEPAAILAELQGRWRTRAESPLSIDQCFFDSFDWRVYASGATLEQRKDAQGERLLWQELDGDADAVVQERGGRPGLLEDLPPGPVRERLAPVLGVRRLLPVVDVRSLRQGLSVLGSDGAELVQVWITARSCEEPAGANALLATTVGVQALPGRAAERKAVVESLKETFDLIPVRQGSSPLLQALEALGRRPGDYSSKIDFRLEPAARADVSTKTILRGLLATLEVNVAGAKAHLDPEFLHDLRVATRRTRSALTQIKGVLPPAQAAEFKGRFAWLQQVTGAARDLDVYRLSLDDYLLRLPSSLRPYLGPLEGFLVARHRAAQRQLTEVLESREFAQLVDDWRAFLDEPQAQEPAPSESGRSTQEVADASIWRLYRRLRREGQAIGPNSPAPELHELRKTAKKLRYLMEFFRRLYPADEINPLIKLCKGLLDNLGAFQDLAVQAAFLREAAHEMEGYDGVDTDTLLAIGVLIGSLLEQQRQARGEFAEVFARVDSPRHRERFQRLFKPSA